MFDYSRAALGLVVEDIRKIARRISFVLSLGLYIYLIASIILGFGYWIANVCLIAIKVAYDIIEEVTSKDKKANRKTRKMAKRGYKYSRLAINGLTIGATMVNMALHPASVTAIAIISTTLLIIVWVLQVLFEIIAFIFEQEVRLIMAGIQKDTRGFTKTINTVKSFLHIGGKEEEEEINYDEHYKKEYDRLDTVVDIPKSSKNKKINLSSAMDFVKKVVTKDKKDNDDIDIEVG